MVSDGNTIPTGRTSKVLPMIIRLFYGWEIGDIELGTTDISLDSIHFSKIREHIQAAYRRGGVNTVSWHARNPETGGGVSEKTTGPGRGNRLARRKE